MSHKILVKKVNEGLTNIRWDKLKRPKSNN
jgi:hypothetical protein